MFRLLLTSLALISLPAFGEAQGTITVSIEGLRSGQGQVLCALYASADGFPKESEKAVRRVTGKLSGLQAQCVFENVPPGTYAVSLFHDENGNRKLDTNFLGIPKEGVGSSRDAKGFFGPPRFSDASFPYSGTDPHLLVHLVYL